MIPIWLQFVLAVAAALLPGGIVVGFWIWARASITKLTGEVEALKAWSNTIEIRCTERSDLLVKVGDSISGVHKRIDALGQDIAESQTSTAKQLGELVGKVSMLVDRG